METDPLGIQVNAMVALGYAMYAAHGPGPWADGLVCAPTSPASMQLTVGNGSLMAMEVVDATAFSSISASSDPLLKMGINRESTLLTALTAPSTTGQSQNFLIQGSLAEIDGGPVALPYYNAANPAVAFSGPSNDGVPQNTKRAQTVALQVLAGAPAAAGYQTTPAVTSGWVPLWVVTLNAGQTTITSSSISVAPAAPFIKYKIPDIISYPLLQGYASRRPAVILTAASGTYTVPANVTWIKFKAVAAGGGGGSAGNSSYPGGGGGGGSGAYCEGWLSVTPGQPYAYAVGAGGALGGAPSSQAGNGGSTTFGAVFSLAGGVGGYGPNTGGYSTSGGPGGAGAAPGYLVIPGGSGNDGGVINTAGAGIGAGTPLGEGGRANSSGMAGGIAGTGYGSGGGGGYNLTGTGGPGAPGIIVIEEYLF